MTTSTSSSAFSAISAAASRASLSRQNSFVPKKTSGSIIVGAWNSERHCAYTKAQRTIYSTATFRFAYHKKYERYVAFTALSVYFYLSCRCMQKTVANDCILQPGEQNFEALTSAVGGSGVCLYLTVHICAPEHCER